MLSQDTHAYVYLLLLYSNLQRKHHLLCFICNHHKTMLISQILNQFLGDILNESFDAHKYIYNIPKTLITKTQQTLKDCALLGSEDLSEGYRDSDLYCLASIIIWQYTTVTNQC